MRTKKQQVSTVKPAFIQVVYSPRRTPEESGWMWRLYDTEGDVAGGGDFSEGNENRLFSYEDAISYANAASKHYGGVPVR